MSIITKIDVRYPDCDSMGIAHHAVYPIWYEMGRMDFFEKCGFGYGPSKALGVDPAMVSLDLGYGAPVTFPGTVTLKTTCTLCAGKKLAFSYELYRENDEKPCATAKSFHIWVKGGKSCNIEAEHPEMFSAYAGSVEPQSAIYDFETLAPARNVCAPVWNYIRSRGVTDPKAISYGVAEMRFPLAPEIKAALHNCVDIGYFGYFDPDGYLKTVCDFMLRRHGWKAEEDWLIQTYGVVTAIGMAIRALTEPGDGVIIQTPVYDPFGRQVKANGRTLVENPLRRDGKRYVMDFADLEEKAARPDVKMLILCSPHNPVGRVWSREELARVSDICRRNGVVVISDEIHNDLVYGAEHTVFAAIGPEAEQNCVVCTAPSKSFNIPGLITSNIFVPNAELRKRFRAESERCAGHFLNPVGITAGIAAYESCGEWLDELCAYIKGNAELFRELVREKLPQAWMPEMEGTYLAWLDLGSLGLSDSELEELVVKKAQLPVNMGVAYGGNGSGFIRVNIGCPRRYVRAFVEGLAEAVNKL